MLYVIVFFLDLYSVIKSFLRDFFSSSGLRRREKTNPGTIFDDQYGTQPKEKKKNTGGWGGGGCVRTVTQGGGSGRQVRERSIESHSHRRSLSPDGCLVLSLYRTDVESLQG